MANISMHRTHRHDPVYWDDTPDPVIERSLFGWEILVYCEDTGYKATVEKRFVLGASWDYGDPAEAIRSAIWDARCEATRERAKHPMVRKQPLWKPTETIE